MGSHRQKERIRVAKNRHSDIYRARNKVWKKQSGRQRVRPRVDKKQKQRLRGGDKG